MKLIDILVRELPKRGGWPDGVGMVEQGDDGGLFAPVTDYCSKFEMELADDWLGETITREQYEAALAATKETKMNWKYIKGSEKDFVGRSDEVGAIANIGGLAIEFTFTNTPIFHYEDVFKESLSDKAIEIIAQREPVAEWVDGLPPAGVECEVRVGDDKFNLCRIVYSDKSFGAAFVYLGGDEDKYIGTIDCVCAKSAASYFKPLRTEAGKRRDDAIEWIVSIMPTNEMDELAAGYLYDAIAGGKILGLKLEK